MKSEILAAKQMTEGMTAAGMPEKQATAVTEAISNGIQKFSVTPDMLHEEIQPIKVQLNALEIRITNLENRFNEFREEFKALREKMDSGFEAINARIFWLIVAVLGTMGAMMASMITVLVTNA